MGALSSAIDAQPGENSAGTASSQRFCSYHQRAGLTVPAVKIIGTEALCRACLDGDPISAPRSFEPTADRGGSAKGPRQCTVLSAAGIERVQHRSERIRSVGASTVSRKKKRAPREGDPLSPRELQVLNLLFRRLGTEEIAIELNVASRTVKYFICSALAKSGTKNRAALIAWFFEKGAAAEPQDPDLLFRASFGRIEAELARVISMIRDRNLRIERQLANVAQIESALNALRAAISGGGECLPKSTS
jgi:DNA-binding CsgD family transcriptional regulator